MLTLPNFDYNQLKLHGILGFNTNPIYTLAQYGCRVTALTLMLNFYGFPCTVYDVNNALKDFNGFQDGGLYVPGSVTKFRPEITETDIGLDFNRLQSLLNGGDMAILELKLGGFNSLPRSYHYVCAVGMHSNSPDTIQIADPNGGVIRNISHYGASKISKIYIYSCNRQPKIINVEPTIKQQQLDMTITTPSQLDQLNSRISQIKEICGNALKIANSSYKNKPNQSWDVINLCDTLNTEVKSLRHEVDKIYDGVGMFKDESKPVLSPAVAPVDNAKSQTWDWPTWFVGLSKYGVDNVTLGTILSGLLSYLPTVYPQLNNNAFWATAVSPIIGAIIIALNKGQKQVAAASNN